MVKTAAMSVAALKTAMKTAAVCRDPEEAARSLAACVSEGTPVLLQSAVAGADDLAASVREQARRICGPQSLYPARIPHRVHGARPDETGLSALLRAHARAQGLAPNSRPPAAYPCCEGRGRQIHHAAAAGPRARRATPLRA